MMCALTVEKKARAAAAQVADVNIMLNLYRERNVKIEQTIAEKSLDQLSDARTFVE